MNKERRTGMLELLSSEKRTQSLTFVVGILVAGFGSMAWHLVNGIDNQINQGIHDNAKLYGMVRSMQIDISKVSEHVINHEAEKQIWVNRILENAEHIRFLQTRPGARSDPFTGTEGRAIESRIKALEKRTHAPR